MHLRAGYCMHVYSLVSVDNAGAVKEVPHLVILQHSSWKPWYVRMAPATILDMAIKDFLHYRGPSKDTEYRALLSDGTLVDSTLSVAQLGLAPEDVIEVHWEDGDSCKGGSKTADAVETTEDGK